MSVKKIHLFPSEESYVANIGSVEADDVALVPLVLAPGAKSGSFNDLNNRPQAYITEAWRSGTAWHRVWSDGFIEQGGHGTGGSCTFSKPFSNTNYTFNVQPSNGYTSHPDWIAAYEKRPSRTTTGTEISWYSGGDQGWDWRASGY